MSYVAKTSRIEADSVIPLVIEKHGTQMMFEKTISHSIFFLI